MPKTFDELLADISTATSNLDEVDAHQLLEDLKDELENMLEAMDEGEDEEEEASSTLPE